MFKHHRKVARSGVTSVEFALVAPVFFLLALGLIELGRMIMMQQALTTAAREGCSTSVMANTSSSSDVEAAVRNYLRSVTAKANNPGKVRVTTPSGLANCASGTNLTVAVEVDFRDVS